MVQANLSPQPPRHSGAIVIPQDRPVYRIGMGKFFGPDDTLYLEGSVIAYDDEPNQEMIPLNALAEAKMVDYLKKLDDFGRKAAEKAGKSYAGLLDSYENARKIMTDESKKVQVIGAPEQVPLMGAKKRGRPPIERVEIAQPTPLMGTVGKLTVKGD